MVWEDALYDSYSFKFVKLCFMTQNVTSLGGILYELEKMCFLLLLNEAVYRCQLYLVEWWCFWVQLCPYYFLPDGSVHFWLKCIDHFIWFDFLSFLSTSFIPLFVLSPGVALEFKIYINKWLSLLSSKKYDTS